MNLEVLKNICEAATTGPWIAIHDRTGVGRPFAMVNSKDACICNEPSPDQPLSNKAFYDHNAEFIATFNPAFCLKLLAVAEALELTLPMAKGYAALYSVGSNSVLINMAVNALATLEKD